MEIYRGAAERLVEIYDFDWKENERMKEACICNLFVHICIYFCIMHCLYIFKHCFFQKIVLIQAFALVAQSIALFLNREVCTNE